MARHYQSIHVEAGDTWRAATDPAYPFLALDTDTSINEVVIHVGQRTRIEPSLAIAQLEQLMAAALELRNALAATTGAPMAEYHLAEPPTGPDEPTDEPTDEPATADRIRCSAVDMEDGVTIAWCELEMTHAGDHRLGGHTWQDEDPDPARARRLMRIGIRP